MSNRNFMQIEDVNKKLEEGLKQIFESDRYQEMLKVMSKFHNYSFNNTIMILLQRPTATMVKGFKGWQELGRHVKKGEKSIKILAPIIKEEEQETEDGEIKKIKRVVGFRMASVFDIQQTEGREIPSVRDFINRSLQEDEGIKQLYQDFKNYIQKEGKFTVDEQPTEKGVGGFYVPKTNEIVISTSENKNEAEKFRVLIHEYAHGLLHNLESPFKDLPRKHQEAQAESVAYVVGNYYGLDTNKISLGYIATWTNDFKLAQQAIKEIQSTSNQIINVLDELQKDKALEFYQNQEKEYIQSFRNLEKLFSVDLMNDDNKPLDNIKNHVFQVVERETGNVYSAKFIESNQGEQLVCQLGNNRIMPVTEIDSGLKNKGRLFPLDLKVVDGYLDRRLNKSPQDIAENQFQNQYEQKIQDTPERVQIKEVEPNKWTVVLNDKYQISKEFHTQDEAVEFKNHFMLSEAINDRVFVENERQMYDSQHLKDYEINVSPFKDEPSYSFKQLEDYSKRYLIQSVQQHLGIDNKQTVVNFDQAKDLSYELATNKHIDSLDKLSDHVKHTRYLPKMKALQNHVEQIKELLERQIPSRNLQLEQELER